VVVSYINDDLPKDVDLHMTSLPVQCISKELQLSDGEESEIVDWAILHFENPNSRLPDGLVEPSDGRFTAELTGIMPVTIGSSPMTTTEQLYPRPVDARQPVQNQIVSKDGAASSETFGRVLRKGLINISLLKDGYPVCHHDVIDSWAAQAELCGSGRYLRVWKIVCANNSDGSREAFSRPGDSGAWVWNENRQLVGVLFGQHDSEDRKHPMALLTSWGSLVNCIRGRLDVIFN
jgi:hypothetical protein